MAALAGALGSREARRERAGADRARVLGWPLAERDRRASRHSARDGEDPNANGPLTARDTSWRGTRVTRPPDLRDLIGDEGGPDERLTRVHELLIDAGP